jgi:ligand-binding sensor domain-containing protein/DNA-binding CsgD family transcriptional regulator
MVVPNLIVCLHPVEASFPFAHNAYRIYFNHNSIIHNVEQRGSALHNLRHSKLSAMVFTILRKTNWFIFFLIASSLAHSEDKQVQWESLTSDEGLSQNSVYAILQDSNGFMWFGTRLGLNRFDGEKFRIFSQDPSDPRSLPGLRVTSLCEDEEGNLWVGTKDAGLARYDKRLEIFTNYSHDETLSESLPSDFVTCLFQDSDSTLWVGTDVGLCRYNKSTDSFEPFRLDPTLEGTSAGIKISTLAELPHGTLWVGMENGSLIKVSLEDLSTEVILDGDRERTPRSVRISSLVPDPSRGVLWVGLFGETILKVNPSTNSMQGLGWEQSRAEGVVAGVMTMCLDAVGDLWIGSAVAVTRHDPDANTFEVFEPDKDDPGALHDNMFYSSYCDPQGTLWIGTESAGISKYVPGLIRFGHVTKENTPNSILANAIFSIVEDERSYVWFGTLGGGLSALNPRTGEYTQYTSDEASEAWSRNYPCKLVAAGDQSIWFSTFYSGLYNLNYETLDITHYINDPQKPKSLGDRTAYALLMATDGTLWVGQETQGLDRFDQQTETFTHFRHDPDDQSSISSNYIYALLEDQDGFIWVGTYDQGLNRFDPRSETFKRYLAGAERPYSLSSNAILSLHEDEHKNLWVGTRAGGLNRIAPDREHITRLDLGPDLDIVNVFGILQDQHEYLWLSTNHGIMKAHPDSGLVHLYTPGDGTQSEFYFGSCLEASDGTMYFGGIEGYTVFHPDSIQHNDHIPPVVLTGLSVNYEKVSIGNRNDGKPLLSRSISYSDQLRFGYRDKVIRFTFAALDFANSRQNRYTYKLVGYDKGWIHSGTDNFAQYMNLPAGQYTFRVRGSNNDGLWNNEGTAIKLKIVPPFWKTIWFRIVLSLLLMGLILLYIQVRTARLRAQQTKLEALVRERTEELKLEMAERQRVELEKTEMKADHLRRELLTQSLYLNKNQQFMEELNTEIEAVYIKKPDEIRSRLKKLQRFIHEKISPRQGWEEFEHWFTEIHTGFYSAIRESFPHLSEQELKICALLRLKMTSKDIARVMNIQPPSVDVFRHRIRKKLDLDSQENLATFLSRF